LTTCGHEDKDGVEFWYARELMGLLGYARCEDLSERGSNMVWTFAYIVLLIVVVSVSAALAARSAGKDEALIRSRLKASLPPAEEVLRHAASRMQNGSYKGSEIELKIFNGDV